MKKLITILILGIFLISFTCAFLGTYERGEVVQIRGKIDNATAISFNLYYPNSTLAVTGESMSRLSGDVWNYTFENTTTLGEYVYDYCDQNGHNCKENYFEVTPSGKTFSEGEGIAGFGVIIAALAISFFFMFFGFKLSDNEKLFPLTILFILISFAFIIYSLHLSYAYTVDILQYESLGSVASTMYTTILWLLVMVGVISVVLILFASIKRLGELSKKKQYGEDFNPVTNSYDM